MFVQTLYKQYKQTLQTLYKRYKQYKQIQKKKFVKPILFVGTVKTGESKKKFDREAMKKNGFDF